MVTSMLEKAIEIEGLLRIIRDGNPLAETYTLLNIKAAQLAEQTRDLKDNTAQPAPAIKSHADFVMTSAEIPEEKPQVVFTAPLPSVSAEGASKTPDKGADYISDDEIDLTEEDDIILSFEEPHEETGESDESMALAAAASTAFAIEAAEPAQASGAEEASETEEASAAEEEAAPAIKAEDEAATGTETKPDRTTKRQTKLKSLFSLNDRFLYSRELFEGNMKMFDSTIEFIEGIEDYSLIEDYFYSELEWDPENSHTAAFMEILRPYFKE